MLIIYQLSTLYNRILSSPKTLPARNILSIMWFTITSRSQSPRALSTYIITSLRQTSFLYIREMSALSKEIKITLVIEAIRITKKMSIRRAAKIYDLLESSFRDRMKGMTPLVERCNGRYRLIPVEEETFL